MMNIKALKNNQSGFTLVEIAIVLVIIGLLLGGVLKGQELIDNARVKRMINDFNAIAAAQNAYYDRYQRLAGDDGPVGTLGGRGGAWTNIPANLVGNNNGTLEAPVDQTFSPATSNSGANGEGNAFFSHLRRAGYLAGNPTLMGLNALPRNPYNGLVGITTEATSNIMNGPGGNLLGLKVCMSQVPGKAAMAIDAQLDDGVGNTGSVRGSQGTGINQQPSGTAATTYNEAQNYIICRAL